MVIPDFELICEIMLVAEGFIDARLLARKFISLYTLCKELLSKQVQKTMFNLIYTALNMHSLFVLILLEMKKRMQVKLHDFLNEISFIC